MQEFPSNVSHPISAPHTPAVTAPYLTPLEAASIARCSLKTIRHFLQSQGLAAFRNGAYSDPRSRTFHSWIRQERVKPVAEPASRWSSCAAAEPSPSTPLQDSGGRRLLPILPWPRPIPANEQISASSAGAKGSRRSRLHAASDRRHVGREPTRVGESKTVPPLDLLRKPASAAESRRRGRRYAQTLTECSDLLPRTRLQRARRRSSAGQNRVGSPSLSGSGSLRLDERAEHASVGGSMTTSARPIRGALPLPSHTHQS